MADDLTRLFAALADPTRRDIVARLTAGDATVGQLAEPYAVSVQAISKHLKVLEDAGLVTRRRDAQRRPVHLETDALDLMTTWIEQYRREDRRAMRHQLTRGRQRPRPDPVRDRPGPAQGQTRGLP
jgi:DNA-binding transcriptional ArsR family regulator